MGDVEVAYWLHSILSALAKSVIKSLKNFEPLLRGVIVCFFRPMRNSILGWGVLDHPVSSVTILWSASGRSRIMAASTGFPSSVVKVQVSFQV